MALSCKFSKKSRRCAPCRGGLHAERNAFTQPIVASNLNRTGCGRSAKASDEDLSPRIRVRQRCRFASWLFNVLRPKRPSLARVAPIRRGAEANFAYFLPVGHQTLQQTHAPGAMILWIDRTIGISERCAVCNNIDSASSAPARSPVFECTKCRRAGVRADSRDSRAQWSAVSKGS